MTLPDPLEQFHSACRDWFRQQFSEPTEAQAKAWAFIRQGHHTLISAPTGSGKTLAAFFAAIDTLVAQGVADCLNDGVHILYVSPLKALSNDIHRNLELPLSGIADQLQFNGLAPLEIKVAVRTGDTPTSERQRMAKTPPHILVTTPESLYLLLTSASGRNMLASVSTLIVDEIHAMLADKRGSHLALSIERLQQLSQTSGDGPLQRIGLSATQKPIEMVANYLVGNSNDLGGITDCKIVDCGYRRKLELQLAVPSSPLSAIMSNEVWEELYAQLVQLINIHDTTLIFVNTRRLSERLALSLTNRLNEGLVCAHHGSMSKEQRLSAEQKLKSGDLKVLVATASMELGIDIGSVDLVVQISSPKSIATFLQRVGRSGHTIHGTPKGVLFPLTRDDLVEASALLHSIKRGELDQIVMPEKPADILAQQIVAEVSSSAKGIDGDDNGWELDDLYEMVTKAYPYRDLSRVEFNSLIVMLSEGYTTRRGRRGAHLHLDSINNRVRARRGANLISLTNGGAIPDMFDYQVVLDPEDVVVGTLNEDFALEALPGDVFTLGTHAWQMLSVDGLKVRVRDAAGMQPTIPFWFGEGPGRTRELSQSVSRLRHTLAAMFQDESSEAAVQWLINTVGLPKAAASQMVDYLLAGMNALGAMPGRETLVMERFFDEVGDMHVVIHSPYGSRLNRAWGLALRKRFCKSFNFELQAAANEDSIVISLGSVHSFPLEEVFHYLQKATVRETLVQAMLDAPMFEVRWRWNATRALAIQRNRNGNRVPPQFQRMDAEDLVAHVFPDQIACQENITGKRDVPDHPLVNQTVTDCLTEAMDIDELESLINSIENETLTLIAKDLREPSPFAQEIINARPYAFLDDAPFEERRTNAIRNRSWADPAEARDFSQLDSKAIARVQHEAWPGIASAEELHDALLSAAYFTAKEMTATNVSLWQQSLLRSGRIAQLDGHARQLWCATEYLPRFRALFGLEVNKQELPAMLASQQWQPADALREILRCRLECLGPVTTARLAGELALAANDVNQALIALEVEGFAFRGHFTSTQSSPDEQTDSELEWCERRLLQRIHRYTLDHHRKQIKPVPLEIFSEFLFHRHHLVAVGEESISAEPGFDGQTRLQNCLNLLDGLSAPAVGWEADIIPARIPNYDPGWLDVLCISGRVAWGRYSPPVTSLRRQGQKRTTGLAKSTPVSLVRRENLDIWKTLAMTQVVGQELQSTSRLARRIEEDLQQFGASFFDQIQSRTGLLRAQLEEGLAELVSLGRLSSDSFTGLRALLITGSRKSGNHRRRSRKVMFGVEDAGRWSLLDNFQANSDSFQPDSNVEAMDAVQLERLISIYLQRWGVLFRGLLERELLAPPWRQLLPMLRRMELRGVLRGGRFVSGPGGEQFAFSETVDELRKFKRNQEHSAQAAYYSLAATDPLNLVNLILPSHKLPRQNKNRVLYRGGVPVALLKSGDVQFLCQVEDKERWHLQKMLTSSGFPPHLKSYLGSR